MRTISSAISRMMPGRPGPRRCAKFHFPATNCRCQRIRVSGETRVSSSNRALRPTAFAFLASNVRSASVNRMRLPCSRSFSNRFSAWRNSMTISWHRWTQPETTISKNVSSGGTEPMPRVYRGPRFNCWTLRGNVLDRGPPSRSISHSQKQKCPATHRAS